MRKFQNYFFIILALTFLSNPTYGQLKERLKNYRLKREQKKIDQVSYLVLETGGAYSINQDLSASNQIYKGAGFGLSIGQYIERPKTIRDYEILGLTNQFNKSQSGVSSFDWTVTMNYGYLFILNHEDEKKWRIAIGPKLDFLTQFRLIPALGNSSTYWDAMLTLGGVCRIDKIINLPLINKDVSFYSEAHLPIVGYLNRPSYGIPGWEILHEFAYLGKMIRLETEVGIITPIRKDNPNLLRISYNWDFFRFQDNEVYRVVTGHHAFNLGLFVRIR